uniref:Alkyl transferase n=1 Tax=Elaeophora elaphi TaxID=1147741 RepID=A0A0R3S1D1_9BILA
MMWFDLDEKKTWWHGLAKYFLTFGPIPEHIAFIMDGNRRYALRQRCSSFAEGHLKGFDKLTKVMQWCREFGVKEVTVYALSLENFKRSATEIDDLLMLFDRKLTQLLDESLVFRCICHKKSLKTFRPYFRDKLVENGIRMQFFGDLERLPPKLRQQIAKIELLTRKHNSGTVNVCIAYTAQDELRRAFVMIAHGVQKGLLATNDINECLISRCLDSRFSNDPDLLIRTSGEARLSDFLLWQCSKCHIYFDEVLWPNFDYWNLCKAIYFYQHSQVSLKQLNENCLAEHKSADNENVLKFLRWADEERLENLRQMSETIC